MLLMRALRSAFPAVDFSSLVTSRMRIVAVDDRMKRETSHRSSNYPHVGEKKNEKPAVVDG
jgi:hypothetical protein